MTTKIMQCSKCKPHPYQDKKYGYLMRVHNLAKAKQGNGHLWRCTVCNSEKQGDS